MRSRSHSLVLFLFPTYSLSLLSASPPSPPPPSRRDFLGRLHPGPRSGLLAQRGRPLLCRLRDRRIHRRLFFFPSLFPQVALAVKPGGICYTLKLDLYESSDYKTMHQELQDAGIWEDAGHSEPYSALPGDQGSQDCMLRAFTWRVK